MSSAFVKEEDGQWLHDLPPTMNSLINYLTNENNGIRVYEQKNFFHTHEKLEAHLMSNGLTYAKDKDGKWFIVW